MRGSFRITSPVVGIRKELVNSAFSTARECSNDLDFNKTNDDPDTVSQIIYDQPLDVRR